MNYNRKTYSRDHASESHTSSYAMTIFCQNTTDHIQWSHKHNTTSINLIHITNISELYCLHASKWLAVGLIKCHACWVYCDSHAHYVTTVHAILWSNRNVAVLIVSVIHWIFNSYTVTTKTISSRWNLNFVIHTYIRCDIVLNS